MLGAIVGDIIGSVYEKRPTKSIEFDLFTKHSRFTDDTTLTVASADCLLQNGDYTLFYQNYGNKYPKKGYGSRFHKWMFSKNPQPYNSWGNGSAMRVSPIAYAFETIEEVLHEAEKSAAVTHNHPEGVKGAQAVAASIFMARNNYTKDQIKTAVSKQFEYDLKRTIDAIRPEYKFDVSCQGSVPESIIAFLESTDFEPAIRLAISLGGDADTQAAIAGSIAEAFYGELPAWIVAECKTRLPEEILAVIEKFHKKYM